MTIPSNQDGKIEELQTQPLMTEETFANLGAPDLAYIRPVQTPEGLAWGSMPPMARNSDSRRNATSPSQPPYRTSFYRSAFSKMR